MQGQGQHQYKRVHINIRQARSCAETAFAASKHTIAYAEAAWA